jgi:hypothetical protein
VTEMRDRERKPSRNMVDRVWGLIVGGGTCWFGLLTVLAANAGDAWAALLVAGCTIFCGAMFVVKV